MNDKQVIEERQKYVSAFNDTMIEIWKEQITLLGVIDSGDLLRSPISVGLSSDGKFSQVQLSQAFLEYGLWQDYGTGAETPRGNSGDIGRVKKRQRRRWFSRKYYASITPETLGSLLQNIVDTMAELNPTSSVSSVSSLNKAIQLLVEDVKLDCYNTYTYPLAELI